MKQNIFFYFRQKKVKWAILIKFQFENFVDNTIIFVLVQIFARVCRVPSTGL